MKKVRLDILLLLPIVVGGFLLRVLPQLKEVFKWDSVIFRGTDAWYHMRLADFSYYNFPRSLLFDAYLAYPQGSYVGLRPLLSWVIAGLGKLGLNMDYVGAFLPPILGTIVLVIVYLLGKELFNKWVGLIGALFVAVLPGEFLHRSLLGYTDHHVLEVLLSSLVILSLVMVLKRNNLKWSILGGVALGLFHLSWHGVLFFVLVLTLGFTMEFLYSYFRGKDPLLMTKSFLITLSISYVIASPYYIFMRPPLSYLIAFVGSMAIPIFLISLTVLVSRKDIYILTLVWSLVVVLLGIFYGYRDLYFFLEEALRAAFWGFGSPIEEARPTDLISAWYSYGLTIPLGLGGFILWIKKKNISILFLVWILVTLLLMVGQRRWNYLGIINIGLLSSYCIWEILQFFKKEVRVSVASVIIVFVLLINIKSTTGIASMPTTITEDWYHSLVWLEENTKIPFQRDLYYLGRWQEPSYGVLSWWDYGHWIIRIAHRVPTSNPAYWGNYGAYWFLVSQSVEEAESHIKDFNVKYIIVDKDIILLPGQQSSKFPAICSTLGLEGDWRNYLENSMAYRLFTSTVEGYELIYREGGVKIFEITKDLGD